MNRSRRMRVNSHLGALLVGFALSLTACGDDKPPPFEWPTSDGGADGAVLPESGVVDDAGDPVDVTCEVGEVITVGLPEAMDLDTSPDRVSVVGHPGGAGFLLATAELNCPEPCDGGFESNWERRRVMLYPIPAGAGAEPGEPVMVGEGVGPLQKTDAQHPTAAVVGGSLVLAWIDNVETERRNVWTRSVALPSLAPQGSMSRVSEFTGELEEARRLVLAGGSSALAIFERFDHASGPPPTLHMASISAAGAPGSVTNLGSIVAGSDAHAAVRLANDTVLFGRTEPTTGGHCDYLVGAPDEDGVAVQEDPATFACGQVALTRGGTAFGAISGGLSVVQFRPLDESGAPIGSERRIAGANGQFAVQPGIAPLSGGFLVVYVRVGLSPSLRGALVTGGGLVVEDFELVPSLGEISNPSVAVSVDGADIAVAWKERVEIEVVIADETKKLTQLETRLVRLHCD
jgi:hypothetical protein